MAVADEVAQRRARRARVPLLRRRRVQGGLRGWVGLAYWAACHRLARVLPTALKKCVVVDAAEHAVAKRGARRDEEGARQRGQPALVELLLAYDPPSERV